MSGGESINSAVLNIAQLNLSTILSRLIIILSTAEHVYCIAAANYDTYKTAGGFLAVWSWRVRWLLFLEEPRLHSAFLDVCRIKTSGILVFKSWFPLDQISSKSISQLEMYPQLTLVKLCFWKCHYYQTCWLKCCTKFKLLSIKTNNKVKGK